MVMLIEITYEKKWLEEEFALLDITVTSFDSAMVESLDKMRMELRALIP